MDDRALLWKNNSEIKSENVESVFNIPKNNFDWNAYILKNTHIMTLKRQNKIKKLKKSLLEPSNK